MVSSRVGAEGGVALAKALAAGARRAAPCCAMLHLVGSLAAARHAHRERGAGPQLAGSTEPPLPVQNLEGSKWKGLLPPGPSH